MAKFSEKFATMQQLENYVSRIVEKFGSIAEMARAVGRPHSTVKSWRETGQIPDGRKPDILKAARERGIALDPADFFPHTDAGSETAAR